MKIYERAGPDVLQMLDRAVRTYHPALAEHGVRIAVTISTDSTGGPGVLHGGYPAAAKISLVTRKRRVHLSADAEIEIDGRVWKRLPEPSRLALLDHELTHLEFCKMIGDPPRPELTDDDRPKLELRLDDWQITGFAQVVQRHGEYAVEYQAVRELWLQHQRLLFPFTAEAAQDGKA